MKRRLFFLLEKLEIKRSERIAMSVLLILMPILGSAWTVQQQNANYSEEQYAKLQKVFEEKSKEIQKEREMILTRYEPSRGVPVSVTINEEPEPEMIQTDTTGQVQETAPQASGNLMNVNTATSRQLQELPGIGPVYAGRIITWREENGDFISKDQLLEIKGIGDKRLAKIKPLVTL